MGRPSALSDRQRAEIGRRLALGESGRKLAKEFKCSESTIRANVSAQVATIQEVAGRLADVERDLERLPVSAQVSARSLADHLKGISTNLAEAALVGSNTTRELAVRANRKLKDLDNQDPEMAAVALKNIGVLHAVGNEASKIAMGLVSSSKGKDSGTSTLEDLVTGRASSE